MHARFRFWSNRFCSTKNEIEKQGCTNILFRFSLQVYDLTSAPCSRFLSTSRYDDIISQSVPICIIWQPGFRLSPHIHSKNYFMSLAICAGSNTCIVLYNNVMVYVLVPWPAEETENRCNPEYVQFQHCLWLQYESVSSNRLFRKFLYEKVFKTLIRHW